MLGIIIIIMIITIIILLKQDDKIQLASNKIQMAWLEAMQHATINVG